MGWLLKFFSSHTFFLLDSFKISEAKVWRIPLSSKILGYSAQFSDKRAWKRDETVEK